MSNFCKSIISIFLSCFAFSSAKADLNPLTRLYLSNKGYAKNMEVQTYIVTKDQIPLLFTEGKIVQKSNKDFHEGDEIFLVICIKNNGDLYASGSLKCSVPNCQMPIVISMMSSFGGKVSTYQTWVVPLGHLFISWEEEYTQVTYRWAELLTY
jgi:hypothetical protein